MATLIPSLNGCLPRMTSGERRFAQRLDALLDADYLCWYEVPVGSRHRHPDFIVLHPQRGLLVVEVRDWKVEHIHSITPTAASVLTPNGLKEAGNPLEQARQYTAAVRQVLEGDPHLVAPDGHPRQGELLCPYGYGVVLANITRRQFESAGLAEVLSPQLVICKDEMMNDLDTDGFQQRLSAMFTTGCGQTLTPLQIDRIRYHLFPEIRIRQRSLFDDTGVHAAAQAAELRVMDLQQELLARGLGEGHRVIHGVAGSGKTLILSYRCAQLARTLSKPVLVLCYNVALATRLEQLVAEQSQSDQSLAGRVIVRHFHGWCLDQLRLHGLPSPQEGDGFPGRLVRAVTQAVAKQQIPLGQYGAVMIDEGHDFEPEWLKLLTQMVDPETNSFLLLYDDAQCIYGKKRSRDFSFAKFGVQARGRTTILRVNYRNTSEVLNYAHRFARDVLVPEDEVVVEDDSIPFVAPQTAGRHGPEPTLMQLGSLQEEACYIADQLGVLHGQGHAWKDMAVFYPARFIGEEVTARLRSAGIPFDWLQDGSGRIDPAQDSVKVMTLYSSKGLEFPVVAIPGVGFMPYMEDQQMEDARLLYVAMTRAVDTLILTAHKTSEFVKQLYAVADARSDMERGPVAA